MGTACSCGKEVEERVSRRRAIKTLLVAANTATSQQRNTTTNSQRTKTSSQTTEDDSTFSDVSRLGSTAGAASTDNDSNCSSFSPPSTPHSGDHRPPSLGNLRNSQRQQRDGDKKPLPPLFSTFVLSNTDDDVGDSTPSSSDRSSDISPRQQQQRKHDANTVRHRGNFPLCSQDEVEQVVFSLQDPTGVQQGPNPNNASPNPFDHPQEYPLGEHKNPADDDEDVVPPASFDDDSEMGGGGCDDDLPPIANNPLLVPQHEGTTTTGTNDEDDDWCDAPLPIFRSVAAHGGSGSGSGSSSAEEFSDLVKSMRVSSLGPLVHTNASSSSSSSQWRQSRSGERPSPLSSLDQLCEGQEKGMLYSDDDDDEEDDVEVCHYYNDDDDAEDDVFDDAESDREEESAKPPLAGRHHTSSGCFVDDGDEEQQLDDDDDNLMDEDDRNDLSSEEGGDGSSGNYYANGLFHQPSSVSLTSNLVNTTPVAALQHELHTSTSTTNNNTSSKLPYRRRYPHPPSSSDSGSVASGHGVCCGGLVKASSRGASSVASSMLFTPSVLSHTMCGEGTPPAASSEASWEVLR